MRLVSLAVTGLPRATLTTPLGARNGGRASEVRGRAVVSVGRAWGVPFMAGGGRTKGSGAKSSASAGCHAAVRSAATIINFLMRKEYPKPAPQAKRVISDGSLNYERHLFQWTELPVDPIDWKTAERQDYFPRLEGVKAL